MTPAMIRCIISIITILQGGNPPTLNIHLDTKNTTFRKHQNVMDPFGRQKISISLSRIWLNRVC